MDSLGLVHPNIEKLVHPNFEKLVHTNIEKLVHPNYGKLPITLQLTIPVIDEN